MLFRSKLPMQEAEKSMVYTHQISCMEQKEIERSFARLFSSEDGKKVLAWLQVMTFQRVQGAGTPEDQLRYMEGQRAMVATILRLIDRGRKG